MRRYIVSIVEEVENNFTGKQAAQLVGLHPSVLTAWAMRGIITPRETQVITARRKNFKYSFNNIIELIIIKRLSECLSIKYDLLSTLSKELFGPNKKFELLEKLLALKEPCLLIMAKTGENISSMTSQPDILLGDEGNRVALEVKMSSWRPEFVNEILKSDLALIVNIDQIREQIISRFKMYFIKK